MTVQKILSQQIANSGGTAGQVLVANSTGVTWGDANNALNLGGVAAASYQTTAGLSANVATLTSNNTSFVGTVSAANVVSNAQLSSNLANYVNTAGAYTRTGLTTFNANAVIGPLGELVLDANAGIYANGSLGTAGQVLTSNATTVYWSTIAGVNVAAQYAWTNTQSFSAVVTHTANVSVNGAIIANGGAGSSGQVLTSAGTGNVYWSNVSASGGGFTNGQSISVSNLAVTGTLSANGSVGTAGQVLVSAGSSSSSYWAATIPVNAYSAQFNGSNQYLTIPNNTALNLASTAFTIEAWVYLNNYTGYNIICAKRNSSSASASYQCYTVISSGYMAFYNGTTDVRTTSVIPLNTWTHLAWVHDGTYINQYLNGVRVNQTSITITEQSINLYIGSDIAGYYFPGYISNFRIVKGVAVYTGAFTVPTSPLGTSQAAGTNISAVTPSQVSLLTCNGPGLIDSSPNAFTVTNINNVVTSQYAPFSSFSAIARSATQTQTILTSGSGTYYPPSGVASLRIRMVGGGGGGGGSGVTSGGSPGTVASAGTNTVFGSSLLTAVGGSGGSNYTPSTIGGAGGAGGSATIGSGATGVNINGGAGGTAGNSSSTNGIAGCPGGVSAFGGAGLPGLPSASGSGGAAATNSGSGGAGAGGAASYFPGTGGGAGGYVEAYISSPAASYTYTVGAGGGGGAAGTSGAAGGGGGSGIIIIEENYAVNASTASGRTSTGGNIFIANYFGGF